MLNGSFFKVYVQKFKHQQHKWILRREKYTAIPGHITAHVWKQQNRGEIYPYLSGNETHQKKTSTDK